ncbi:MAG: type II toxin-antitoxin system RelE/ParE family toxin [Proteobacteria bacterium]|nr:type II toxin-antitoxin system RelE/ParE family toxin [Pseudomonadota bacterium]
MPHIYKQSAARQDLIEIWLYSFTAWGESQADKYLDDLEGILELLAQQPLICHERMDISPPVRIHHYAHHLIVYTIVDDGINIIRVLHENMDIETRLNDA